MTPSCRRNARIGLRLGCIAATAAILAGTFFYLGPVVGPVEEYGVHYLLAAMVVVMVLVYFLYPGLFLPLQLWGSADDMAGDEKRGGG